MKGYNGWSSWNEWNCVLWLSNDDSVEQCMRDWVNKEYSPRQIICKLKQDYLGEKTPDGARYNLKAIRSYVNSYME